MKKSIIATMFLLMACNDTTDQELPYLEDLAQEYSEYCQETETEILEIFEQALQGKEQCEEYIEMRFYLDADGLCPLTWNNPRTKLQTPKKCYYLWNTIYTGDR